MKFLSGSEYQKLIREISELKAKNNEMEVSLKKRIPKFHRQETTIKKKSKV